MAIRWTLPSVIKRHPATCLLFQVSLLLSCTNSTHISHRDRTCCMFGMSGILCVPRNSTEQLELFQILSNYKQARALQQAIQAQSLRKTQASLTPASILLLPFASSQPQSSPHRDRHLNRVSHMTKLLQSWMEPRQCSLHL